MKGSQSPALTHNNGVTVGANIPAIAFAPDPEGAVALIEAISRVHDLEVDMKELLEKAEEIRKKLKELADQHRKMRKAEEKRGAPVAMCV